LFLPFDYLEMRIIQGIEYGYSEASNALECFYFIFYLVVDKSTKRSKNRQVVDKYNNLH